MSLSTMKCKDCGKPFRELVLLALLADAGAQVSPSPELCMVTGLDHELIDTEPAK